MFPKHKVVGSNPTISAILPCSSTGGTADSDSACCRFEPYRGSHFTDSLARVLCDYEFTFWLRYLAQ